MMEEDVEVVGKNDAVMEYKSSTSFKTTPP